MDELEQLLQPTDAAYLREVVMAGRAITNAFERDGALKIIVESLRADAAEALNLLIEVDAENPALVRELQCRVRQYEQVCTAIRNTVSQTLAEEADLSNEQRAQLEALINEGDLGDE